MAASMTGFASITIDGDFGHATWELRAVNHRFIDLHFRLPDSLKTLETACREACQKRLRRGKIDCSLRFIPSENAQFTVNTDLIKQLAAAQETIADLCPTSTPSDLLRWPGVIKNPSFDEKALTAWLLTGLQQALDELILMRAKEGTQLAKLLNERLQAIRPLVDTISQSVPDMLKKQREKLQARLAELTADVDHQRFEQEVALIAQRMDIAEEIDRLNAHCEEVAHVLTSDKAIGRRLDFLMQELNRETNTVASKSVDKATTHTAVDLKVLIEQMREQVQNIE